MPTEVKVIFMPSPIGSFHRNIIPPIFPADIKGIYSNVVEVSTITERWGDEILGISGPLTELQTSTNGVDNRTLLCFPHDGKTHCFCSLCVCMCVCVCVCVCVHVSEGVLSTSQLPKFPTKFRQVFSDSLFAGLQVTITIWGYEVKGQGHRRPKWSWKTLLCCRSPKASYQISWNLHKFFLWWTQVTTRC